MHGRTAHPNRQAHKPRPRIPREAVTATLVAGLLGLSVAFGTSTLDVYRLQREATELTRTKQLLQDQNALLREEIKLLYTPAYIEKLAREQLGLVKPGEIAVLVVHPSTPPPEAPPSPSEQSSWAARLWSDLAGLFSH